MPAVVVTADEPRSASASGAVIALVAVPAISLLLCAGICFRCRRQRRKFSGQRSDGIDNDLATSPDHAASAVNNGCTSPTPNGSVLNVRIEVDDLSPECTSSDGVDVARVTSPTLHAKWQPRFADQEDAGVPEQGDQEGSPAARAFTLGASSDEEPPLRPGDSTAPRVAVDQAAGSRAATVADVLLASDSGPGARARGTPSRPERGGVLMSRGSAIGNQEGAFCGRPAAQRPARC